MSGSSILVVEDEAIVGRYVQSQLERMGYSVTDVVAQGEQALDAVATRKPELVLMDIMLQGGIDGPEAALRIRRNWNVPVVYLTAYADEQTLSRAKLADPVGYVLKPFTSETLKSAIEIGLFRHEMESRLHASHQWFYTTLRSIGDAVIATDPQGRISFLNPGAEALTGWQAADAKGKPLGEVFRLIDDQAVPQLAALVDQAIADKAPVKLHDRILIDRDGRHRYVADSIAPILDEPDEVLGVVLVCQDVTAQRQAERQLEQTRQQLHQIIECAEDIICVHAPDGRYLYYSGPKKYGVTMDDLEGKTPADLLDPQDAQPIMEQIARVARTGQSENQINDLQWQGETLWFSDLIYPMKGDDGQVRAVGKICRNVTRQVRTEQALRRSEKRYRTIFENVQDALVIFDLDETILDCNEHLCELVGRPRNELIGQSIRRYCTERTAAGLRERIDQLLDRKAMETEVEVLDAAGRAVPMSVSASLVQHDGGQAIQSALRDISRRKRDEENLRRHDAVLKAVAYASERFLCSDNWQEHIDAVLERLGQAVGVSRAYVFQHNQAPDGTRRTTQRYEWVKEGIAPQIDNPRLKNFRMEEDCPRWEKALGGGEIIAGPVSDLPDEERAFLETQTIQSLAVVPIFVEGTWWGFMGFDDCRHPREWTPGDLDALRTAAAVLASAIHRRQALDEQQAFQEQLQQAQKLESLGVLAGGVAHDFNNLLTTVLGNAELAMMDHPQSGPLRDSLEEIRKAAMRASNLSGQMLAYSGQGRLQTTPVHLGAMVEQMTPLLTATVSRQIRLDIHTEEDLPTVTGDPTQLKQVVINLVTNAAEAIGAVRGTISLSLTTVDVGRDQITNPAMNDCLRAGRHVCLEVADTGSGMDPETQRRLFDPFFTTKFTGRGLGLAAVLGIVRSHQGGIQVRSEWGTGSSFRVLLPVAEDGKDARALHHAADPADTPTAGTVLIVDDEESVRRTARRMLQHHGLNVIEAADGQEALQVVRHQGQDLDMVLLDLTMPGLSGERTCRRIGQLLPDLPIVMTSGYEAEHAEQAFAETGARGFLKKPFDMARLIKTVQELVKHSS